MLGRAWPLPVGPVPVGLLLLFALVAGAVWWFEGRFSTTAEEAAKRLVPLSAEQIQSVNLATPDGRTSFSRGADGKMAVDGTSPASTPTPSPAATPGLAPATLSPSARVESIVNQLSSLTVDRVVLKEASASSEYGLDIPRMTLSITPKTGGVLTLAIGDLSPDESSYYVRRDTTKDTVLVSRYSIDDLIKVAGEVLNAP